MFYAFILQDALRFGICGEDVVADLAEAIKNYRWAEFEARLDVHHASLIQHREAEALDFSWMSITHGTGVKSISHLLVLSWALV